LGVIVRLLDFVVLLHQYSRELRYIHNFIFSDFAHSNMWCLNLLVVISVCLIWSGIIPEPYRYHRRASIGAMVRANIDYLLSIEMIWIRTDYSCSSSSWTQLSFALTELVMWYTQGSNNIWCGRWHRNLELQDQGKCCTDTS
jgi:hypothetical protein